MTNKKTVSNLQVVLFRSFSGVQQEIVPGYWEKDNKQIIQTNNKYVHMQHAFLRHVYSHTATDLLTVAHIVAPNLHK